jgi:hypothetical protein
VKITTADLLEVLGVSPEEVRAVKAHAPPKLVTEGAYETRLVEVKRLPYVPGFGGHKKHSACKCTEADEYICGAPHPDAHESREQIERRLKGATIIALREARMSEWLAELFGTGADRDEDYVEPYRRPSRATARRESARRDRPLSDAEWRRALIWIRRQPLRGALVEHRVEIAAQAWIELRRPPAGEKPKNFLDEVRRAWERAVKRIRQENEGAWTMPKPSEFKSTNQKRKALEGEESEICPK